MPSGEDRRWRRCAAWLAALIGLLSVALVVAPAVGRADIAAGWRAYVDGDYEAAIREWRPLAVQGDHEAAFGVGMAWQIIGEPARAVPWYERAARAGSTDAQILLGTIYASGVGVPRNLVRAYAWLHVAAEQEHPNAVLVLDAVSGQMTAEQIEAGKELSANP